MKVFAKGKNLETLNYDELKLIVRDSACRSLEIENVVRALDLFSKKVLTLDLDQGLAREISTFCSQKGIEGKLKSELGSINPFDIKRRDFKTTEMESYYPLGTLLHITSSNSEGLAFLALVEGLISGNINIVKLSRRDSDICFKLVEILLSFDKSNFLKDRIVLLQDASIGLEELIDLSDGVSCWGGDSALNSIRALVPSSKRFITWGHKISFALIDMDGDLKTKADKLVLEILKYNQQACSAPQVCYVLDASFSEIRDFSKLLDEAFSESLDITSLELDIQEKAELTNYNQLLKLESLVEDKGVIVGRDHQWRIYTENNSDFKPSPLNRTIWIKPLKREDIIKTFVSHRDYLQTVGVSLSEKKIEFVRDLLSAGVTRVRELGRMQESYSGEPHDGEYALRRFVKKVSIDLDMLSQNFRLDERIFKKQSINKNLKVMSKEDFQNMDVNESLNHLFFRSGGSSGKTAISPFSYNSYHVQMKAAAEGLLASGLNPSTDRCGNLFFGGGLYGGFISFFTILEMMEAIQFPIAAYEDKEFVAKVILDNRVDTLLGMPSYIIDLFKEQAAVLRKSSVKKIFFGGEHFPDGQKHWLKEEFGVEIIRSASYGSVDAGPLGFQCECCEGSEHHLNETIQQLEILKIESDEEVLEGEVGRLVFTSKARDSVSINRYDLGDLGRMISKECDCGRKNLKFELLGRHGDIFRAGGTFFNFTKIQRVLEEYFSYGGSLQVIIDNSTGKDSIEVVLDNKEFSEEEFMEKYKDLYEAVQMEQTVLFSMKNTSPKDFLHSKNSGKLLRVIDKRIF
ncbi:acyl-CoA reductase [Halobacteriovorax sp. JY17]|uniref:acyl-CoA reductase n=1 Tax=Halobacteriovorax sp. JY17 TaxID=2014617 RepID=UPI000C5D7E87|nr:acyl-CoA reductase [Halobacteriovorax sp. JY17]PIK14982.1 MAG: hypothetical protein CES88_11655 [Halobacteriovorax sp. JY17]